MEKLKDILFVIGIVLAFSLAVAFLKAVDVYFDHADYAAHRYE